ncbi:Nucleoside-diphosphate-sugar epimerase [Loktanella fryxellensis]|uniref:Nucleoside-diphosphate-sugar epimerase n=1 Tax=Loktanella fryxellensis TaxID=245187 RepID=A0A1H8JTB6_9RHOB|nr:NAD(P)-dependent oxidoreductase [Loktanella fryxellensis]SEN83980.1 Nucleoside-diphosphate-sugar epimerase [Loktanella fryxellensis]
MRIFFTGGSGKAGKYAVQHLRDLGHLVTNVDLAAPADGRSLRVDLADAGQVANAMQAYADFDDLDAGTGVPRYDAVVHFAAVPRILVVPDNETFRINTMSTYNVIDAATRAGIRKIIFASSETTYGVCFHDGEKKPAYIPVDEEHPTVPQDSYAMSKVVNEATARSFQARSGADIYGLRINNVIEPHEYAANFPDYVAHPEKRRRNIFAYIDARDLAQMVERCLAVDGLGYQVFNVSNDDSSVGLPSADVTARFYTGLEQRRPMGTYETFYDNTKAKRMVGFAPSHGWRDVVGG